MSAPCQHDLLDWFTATGPTLATLAAVAATVWAANIGRQVSRDALALQRRMSGPRLSILERQRRADSSGLEWVVEIRNDGQTAANIEAFRVIVDGKQFDHRVGEDPRTYWFNALRQLGLMSLGGMDANFLVPPNAIAAGQTQLLFSVTIVDPEPVARVAMRRLRFEVEYGSLWDEKFSVTRDFGNV